jgi:hypothetical protein
MMKCPTCGLVGRDAQGDADGRAQIPPVGAIVLCECGAVNRAEATGDALLTILGARFLRTLAPHEFDRLEPKVRASLESSIELMKRSGRYGKKPASELDKCAECGHERRQHLDVRWPCNMLACGCEGFKQSAPVVSPETRLSANTMRAVYDFVAGDDDEGAEQ